ncbi:MAG: hypothetical protein ABI990_03395 [Actinomycetota bacterium]
MEAAALTPSRIPPVADAISLRDRVRVPDGRVGKVIGFYRRDEVSVCVLFDGGDSGQFLNALLSPLG